MATFEKVELGNEGLDEGKKEGLGDEQSEGVKPSKVE